MGRNQKDSFSNAPVNFLLKFMGWYIVRLH
jgi:hypothetical protein